MGGVAQRSVVQPRGGGRLGGRPGFERGAREPAQRDHGADVTIDQKGVEPAVPVGRDVRICGVAGAAALTVNAVQERVDHHVTGRDADARE